MKLLILSDLHLEFSNMLVSDTEADIVILPGDIWKGDNGIHWARATWPNKEIVYICGNHEFYGKYRKNVISMCHIAAAETGVHFLDNSSVVIDDFRFLGSTLWTDFKLYGADLQLDCMHEAESCMNDFRVIHEDGGHFSTMDSLKLHNESVAWLTKELREPYAGKTVVVTHHAPSFESVVPKYRKGLLSAAFASKLDHLMGKAVIWAHGHCHDSLDYKIRGTRVICNPRGYSRFEQDVENFHFNPNLVIEIEEPELDVDPTIARW